MNFICEGLDRLGKDSLIAGIKNACGYYNVLHRSKPEMLDAYKKAAGTQGTSAAFLYQRDCFSSDMALLWAAEQSNIPIIFNRSWIGEAVYADIYRGYSGAYVFDLEMATGVENLIDTRLILLTENFSISKHFVDDGLSFDPTKRRQEQDMFIAAFNRSLISNKKMICVTGSDGQFRPRQDILAEALA